MGTGSHLGLSFSEVGVLMSTLSSEKDSLLRLPVPVKIAPKKGGFFVTPFYVIKNIILASNIRVIRIQITFLHVWIYQERNGSGQQHVFTVYVDFLGFPLIPWNMKKTKKGRKSASHFR